MKELIKEIEGLSERVGKVEPQSAYLVSARGALSAAQDNLRWHEEKSERELKSGTRGESGARGNSPLQSGSGKA